MNNFDLALRRPLSSQEIYNIIVIILGGTYSRQLHLHRNPFKTSKLKQKVNNNNTTYSSSVAEGRLRRK